MEKLLASALLLCLFGIFFVVQPSPAAAQEVEDETEFNYNLTSKEGPQNWGRIHTEWSACGNGTMQSPIDLLHERVAVVPLLGRIKKNYNLANATLKNRGHDMMLKWEGDAGYIRLNGKGYSLQQLHWHSPSEHTINGRRFDLELHMVHESHDGKFAVIGILYKKGRRDPFLWELRHHLKAVSGSHEKDTVVGRVSARSVLFGSRKYYRYVGSLTTPPCTEGVIWTIVNKVRTVTREQLKLLRVAVHDESDSNARPTQVYNARTVHFYRPNTDDDKSGNR